MQDELKKVISQVMNTNSEFEQQSIAQFDGELSDEDLDTVAGGHGRHHGHHHGRHHGHHHGHHHHHHHCHWKH